jgi:glucokinase
MPKALGLDIGGTYIKAGLVDKRGKLYEHKKIPTEAKKGTDKVIENIISIVESFDIKDIRAIGVGIPGSVDTSKGVIINTPNLPLHGVDIQYILKSHFKKKVKINNDANCFGIAEAKAGNGKLFPNVLCLTLGTGIGSAMIIKKKLYVGRGNAPELGHTTIHFKGLPCKCCNPGCVEEYISTRGLLRIAKNKKIKVKDTLDLFLLAERHNRKAIKTFEAYGEMLGLVLSNFVNTFDPDVIVLGGQVTGSWRFFNKSMTRELNKRSFIPACKVVRTDMKEAGVIGAGLLV